MGRVINANSPGKARNQHRRTVAELLRLLSRRRQVDQEAKDMAAAMVFALRGIHESTLQTIAAWEKRNYWSKADRFMREWEWAEVVAKDLDRTIREGDWLRLPTIMATLLPHFNDVDIKKFTRSPSLWRGAYRRLLSASGEQVS